MADSVIGNYTVAWICALHEEYEAAYRMLDVVFDPLPRQLLKRINADDNNTYDCGRINGHYVVIGYLPSGRYGVNAAAAVAKDMVRTFPNIRFGLMVGIGGGAPTQQKDVRLGDVVVSQPEGNFGGVVQIDIERWIQRGGGDRQPLQVTRHLNSPPAHLLGVTSQLLQFHQDPRRPDKLAENIRLMNDVPSFRRPPQDQLYRAGYLHQSADKGCQNCQRDQTVQRPRRAGNREVMIHHGTIASSDTLMKDAFERDRCARELGVLCFEMEAAGLMNNLPCLVVRGICDYSDSHKNDDWHNYAALTAAAYARELLYNVKPAVVQGMPSWTSAFR
ncbi:hypothetical protein TWF106_001393 [Orbilia oligospora]|uniref:Uncharacterized protein n=1 Tax=Orbilia oligospora TaxID=2813651 RepID=A0A7C8U8X3_ORBOL|nr:hypothetical protein TWF788_003493 [Orbilia oligospora]KAF3204898.1 hypothetical protein TWF106_001393 [Orbilia oligospora]